MCRIVNPVRNAREIFEFWIDKGARGDWATCDKKKETGSDEISYKAKFVSSLLTT